MFKLSIVLIILSSIAVTKIIAGDKWSMNPVILKDTMNVNIPEGKIKFIGKVLNSAGQSVPDFNIKVANSSLQKVNWDNSGTFEILVDTSFTFISFTSPNHVAIQMNNNGFESQHEITLKTTMQMNPIIPFQKKEIEVMTYKPVIYLYGPDKENIELVLSPSGKFTFTYPQIEQSKWVVDLLGNQIQYKGQNFPYLFYETINEDMNFKRNSEKLFGHISLQSDLIEYLETSLTSMGLTRQEQTDFITFWGPRMMVHSQVFIQFWVDETYNEIATLKISPQPESSKRIYVVFCPIEGVNSLNYEEQTFEGFQRKGFTIIEWGGSQLPPSKIEI